jgi:hypothetical protein
VNKVEAEFDVSHSPNPSWRKLWDILLRPLSDDPDPDSENNGTETSKQDKKSKPQQLSLFPLDKSELERNDPDRGLDSGGVK